MKSQEIIKTVCEYFAQDPEVLKEKGWTGEINKCRQIAMFLLKEFTDETLAKIGRRFDRDHATVIHAIKCVNNGMATSVKYDEEVNELRRLVNPDLPKAEDDVFMQNDFYSGEIYKEDFKPFERPYKDHQFRKNYLIV